MSLTKIKWSLYRILFFTVFSFCVLTGVGIYIAAPLITHCYFDTFRFWKFVGYFPSMMRFAYRHVFMLIGDRDYRRYMSVSLMERPMAGPDRTKVRISDRWEWGEETCGNCNKCCTRLRCPLYDRVRNCCLSHNSPYWRYFNCGRYPINQAQIDYYQCPKWEVIV